MNLFQFSGYIDNFCDKFTPTIHCCIQVIVISYKAPEFLDGT